MSPDYLVIGAQRSGTTALYPYLSRNRHIGRARRKEVHFFDFNYHRGMGWYKYHFPTLRRKRSRERLLGGPFITGEASPYYLVNPLVPARVHKALPSVKLIVLLRNPVERAYSHFHQQRRRGHESASSFEEAIERETAMLEGERPSSLAYRRSSYLARGIYVDQLQRWHALFPREQMLILKSEEFFRDPIATERTVCEFLGMPPRPRAKRVPRGKKWYPPLDPSTREFLSTYYREHNQRLYEYLGRDFGWT
jgi:Sulfotransferase domain